MHVPGCNGGAAGSRSLGAEVVFDEQGGGLFLLDLVASRRVDGRRGRGKREALEDRTGGLGWMDRREDPQRSAAAGALEDVDGEDAAHELGPGEPPGPARGRLLGRRYAVGEPFGIVRGGHRARQRTTRRIDGGGRCSRHASRPGVLVLRAPTGRYDLLPLAGTRPEDPV